MVVLEVYTKSIKTKYKVRILSQGTLVFIILSILSIILPFIIAYKTKGFWLKRDVFYETPDVKFKGQYLLTATTNNMSHPIACSSYPVYMKYMKKYLACPQIKVFEDDRNYDGKIDELTLEIKINLPENIYINAYTLIIPLELKLHEPSCPLEMQTEIILQQQIKTICTDINILADMDIKQTSPLFCSSKRTNTAFNYSSINENHIKNYKLESIAKRHREKNITTTVSNIFTSYETKHKDYLTLNLKLRYTEQKFNYKPEFLQIMKWAWIQFYALYIIVHYIAKKIKIYIFENRLVLFYEKNPIKS